MKTFLLVIAIILTILLVLLASILVIWLTLQGIIFIKEAISELKEGEQND